MPFMILNQSEKIKVCKNNVWDAQHTIVNFSIKNLMYTNLNFDFRLLIHDELIDTTSNLLPCLALSFVSSGRTINQILSTVLEN